MSGTPNSTPSSTPKVVAAIVVAAAAAATGSYVTGKSVARQEMTTAAAYDASAPSPIIPPATATLKAIIQTNQVYGGTP